MHASNYFAIRGSMPKDKDKILKAAKCLIVPERSPPAAAGIYEGALGDGE